MADYSDLFDKSAPDDPARAGLNLRFGLEAKPDLAAEEGQLARRYGLPPGVIQQYRPDYEARAKVEDARPLLTQAPVLRGWLAENPQNARVSHDDLGPLAGLEVYSRAFRRGLQGTLRGGAASTVMESAESLDALERNVSETEGGAALFPQAQRSRARAQAAAGDRLSQGVVDFNARSSAIDELPASEALQRFNQSKTFAEGVRRLVGAPGVIPELMAESFGAMAPTMPLAIGGGALAGVRGLALGTGLSSSSVEMAGALAEVLREMKVDTADPDAVRAAIASPEFREAFGAKARKAAVVGAFDALTASMLGVKIGPNAATNIFGQMGLQAAGGGAGEALGSLAAGEEINPAAVLAEMVAEMPGAAGDVAVLAGRRALGMEQKAQDAEHNAQALQALMALATESKLRERDPATFQQFVDQVAADGPVQEVFVDARTFAQLAGDTLPTLMQEMPSVRSQLEEALVRGGDIEIPLGELTTKLAGTPLEQPLLEHLKVDADGMTLAERRTFEQGQAETVKAEIERIMATAKVGEEVKKQAAVVEADVLRQLNEARRFTPDTNAAYAKLMGAFFSTLAGRLQRAGESVAAEDLYRQFALRVTAEGVPGAQMLDQAGKPVDLSVVRAMTREQFDAWLQSQDFTVQSKIDQISRGQGSQGYEKLHEAIANYAEDLKFENPRIARKFRNVKPDDLVTVYRAVSQDDPTTKIHAGDWVALEPGYAKQHGQLGDTPARLMEMKVPARDIEWAGTSADEWFYKPASESSGAQSRYQAVLDYLEKTGGQTLYQAQRTSWRAIRDSVLAKLRDVYRKPVTVSAKNGDQVVIAWSGIRHALHNGVPSPAQSLLALHLEAAIRNATLERVEPDYKGRSDPASTSIYGVTVLIDDAPYRATIFARNHSDGRRYYDHAVVEMESPPGLPESSGESLARSSEPTPPYGGLTLSLDELGPLGKGELFQSARGQITFGADITQSPSVITLLKNADLSTFLHESGHFYLEVLASIAGRQGAPAEVQADMTQILAWFGVPDLATWQAMPLEQKRPYHEQFARGFEAYLFEGRAPSVELQGLFSRFRAWLLNVYRQITGLNVQLTPEVRGVFDRMLASEQEIREAEAARGYAPLFKSAEEMGATPEEWAQYQALGRDATEEATEQLQARSLRDMRWLVNARGRKLRELQRTAEAQRRAVELEVTAEVRQVPVYAAMYWLKTGILPDGTQTVGAKLDLDALREMYGEGPAAPWRYLPTGERGLAGKEGMQPDQVAEMFWFTSGDELVRSILAAEPEGPMIESMTDQRMLERYGDLATPAGLERAANEALHNEARGRFIATELAALQKAVGNRNLLIRAAKDFAAGLIGRKKIRDIRPAQYTAAEARAARAAERASGLTEKATEKRNQLVNHYAARTAMDATAEIERALAYLKRFEGAVDTIDASYLDQIHQLLEGVELRRITERESRRRASLLEWIQEQEAQGLDPVIPRELVEQARQRNYREMTLEEFRGLVDAVKNIEHLGRLKKKLLTARDQRELAQVVEELATSIGERANREAKVRIEQGRGLALVGKIARGFVAMHRKFASIAREMDGGVDGGPMWERLVRPMNEAGDREVEMRAEATRRLAEIFGGVKGTNLTRKEEVLPGVSMTREAQIMLALNWGNEGNRQRVIDGGLDGRRRLTQAEAESIVFRLTEREWDFVEAVWAMLEHYRPAIAEQEKRLTGVEPKWVEPAPFTLLNGRRISGGYFPAKYDADLSTRSNELEAITDLRQQMKGAAGRAATRNGYTKERSAEVKDRPLRKDFGVIMQHLGEVTHRLAWQDWLIDARRILNAGPLDDAIRKHYGTEILREIKTQLADIAQGDLAAASDLDRILGHVRSGVTIVGMGWNVVTALMQPFGYTQSIVRVGARWMGRGLAHFAANPMRAAEEAREKSSFMRTRALTINRDLADILNRVDNEKLSAVESTYFLFIQKMQTAVDVPTWWAGYERAVAEGNDEARAIALADQAVIDSQGGGHLKDQARIQRGTPALKLFTAFYNYFNTTYNLLVEQTRTAPVRGGLAIPKLASDYLMLLVVPALGSALLKAMLKGEDDEEKLAETLVREQLNYLFGQMILLREMGAAVQAFSGGYGGPAGLRVFAEIAKLGKQVEQGEVDAALLKAANNVAGIVFHYPAGQVQRTMEGFEALSSGKTANPFSLLLGYKEK